MKKLDYIESLKTKIVDKSITIGIIGLGYVGLPTAVFFAKNSIRVTGIDINLDKIKKINNGINPLPDLDYDCDFSELVKKGFLSATSDFKVAVKNNDIFLLVLPTPVNGSKEPDLSYIINACKELSKCDLKGKLIVLESTVYPGVTDEIVASILSETGLTLFEEYSIAYAPERYNPGDKTHDIYSTAKIVGCNDPDWGKVCINMYQIIIRDVYFVGSTKIAEAAKVIENIQRDLNIALMNEIALICELMEIDVVDVIKAASTKWNFLKFYPGAGVGGHCLPHDPYYLVKKAQELGYIPQIILAGRKVNDAMPLHIKDLILLGINELNISVKKANITIFGASYKENIGDARSSPTEQLILSLKSFSANITILDPFLEGNNIFGHKLITDPNLIPKNTNVLALMVPHRHFLEKTFLMDITTKLETKNQVLIDGRRIFDQSDLPSSIIKYYGVGYTNYS
jgi:nucleotide sugar dehydrogenase